MVAFKLNMLYVSVVTVVDSICPVICLNNWIGTYCKLPNSCICYGECRRLNGPGNWVLVRSWWHFMVRGSIFYLLTTTTSKCCQHKFNCRVYIAPNLIFLDRTRCEMSTSNSIMPQLKSFVLQFAINFSFEESKAAFFGTQVSFHWNPVIVCWQIWLCLLHGVV